MNIKVVSLYSGCGGLDFGFHQLNYKLVFANDIDKDSCNSFFNLIGLKPICANIRDVKELIPKNDVIIGGPPCQSFSLLGKRKKNDERGNEVFNFLEIIKSNKPKAFLFENVPGLVASYYNNQRLNLYLIEKFKQLGYEILIQKFDCTEYFIPQTRKRIIIIGWKKNLNCPKIPNKYDLIKYLGINYEKDYIYAFDALNDLPFPSKKKEEVKYKKKPNNFFLKFIRGKNGEKVKLHTEMRMSPKDKEYIKYIPPGGNYRHIPKTAASKRVKRIQKTGGRTTTYGRLHPKKFSATVNTYFNRPNVGTNYHYSQKRLITPREALRLQSFPDYFTPNFSNNRSLYSQIGNAVPPLLSIVLALSVKSIFKKK